MAYTQLTLDMRKKIEFLFYLGKSQAHMARTLGVSRSTISRELERNGSADRYNAFQAHRLAKGRKKRQAVLLQPKRPQGNYVLARLLLNIRKDFWEVRTVRKFFNAEDNSFRMWRSKRNPYQSGFTWVRKELTFVQKLDRNRYLRKRIRYYVAEELFRGPRVWYGIIRSVFSKVGQKYFAPILRALRKKEEEQLEALKKIAGSKRTPSTKALTTVHLSASRSSFMQAKDTRAGIYRGKLRLPDTIRKFPPGPS